MGNSKGFEQLFRVQGTLVKCPVCREIFESSILLEHHMQLHKDKIEDKQLRKPEENGYDTQGSTKLVMVVFKRRTNSNLTDKSW